MNTYSSKYKIGDTVTLKLKEHIIRWCTITSIKFEEDNIKYDIQLYESDTKLYDISGDLLTGIEEEAENQITGYNQV